MKPWKPWKCTNELKFEDGILHQKWEREQSTFGASSHSIPPYKQKQKQWRPIPGQTGVTDILKDTDESENQVAAAHG